ncbi:MAG: aa3-type cytochrome c oxidase subunit IV [Paracoccaceae bacterium]
MKGTEMGEYERGSMDVTEQQKTFGGFVKIAALVSAVTLLVLIFLAFVGT